MKWRLSDFANPNEIWPRRQTKGEIKNDYLHSLLFPLI